MKRKLVVFGAGPHARDRLVPALLATDRCELTAWVDPSTAARGLASQQFPHATVVADLDWRGIAADTLIVIATPITTHRALFETAVGRGLDCFIEKPLAATFTDAQAMCEKLCSHGPRATVGLWMRHSPLIQSVLRRMPALRASELTVRTPSVPDGSLVNILDTFVYLLDLALVTHRAQPIAICVGRRNPPVCLLRFTDQSQARLIWQDARPVNKDEKWRFSWTDDCHRAVVSGLTRLEVFDHEGRRLHEERAAYDAGFRHQLEQLLHGQFLVPLTEAAHANQLFDALTNSKLDSWTPV